MAHHHRTSPHFRQKINPQTFHFTVWLLRRLQPTLNLTLCLLRARVEKKVKFLSWRHDPDRSQTIERFNDCDDCTTTKFPRWTFEVPISLIISSLGAKYSFVHYELHFWLGTCSNNKFLFMIQSDFYLKLHTQHFLMANQWPSLCLQENVWIFRRPNLTRRYYSWNFVSFGPSMSLRKSSVAALFSTSL